jgi:hypothetical protein
MLSYGKRWLWDHDSTICIFIDETQNLKICFSWHQRDDGRDDGAKEQRPREDKTYGTFAFISIPMFSFKINATVF